MERRCFPHLENMTAIAHNVTKTLIRIIITIEKGCYDSFWIFSVNIIYVIAI